VAHTFLNGAEPVIDAALVRDEKKSTVMLGDTTGFLRWLGQRAVWDTPTHHEMLGIIRLVIPRTALADVRGKRASGLILWIVVEVVGVVLMLQLCEKLLGSFFTMHLDEFLPVDSRIGVKHGIRILGSMELQWGTYFVKVSSVEMSLLEGLPGNYLPSGHRPTTREENSLSSWRTFAFSSSVSSPMRSKFGVLLAHHLKENVSFELPNLRRSHKKLGYIHGELGYSLLVCAKNHEATILRPSGMLALISIVPNEDNTVSTVNTRAHAHLSGVLDLPGLHWVHASFRLGLGLVVQTDDNRLADTINPTKAAQIRGQQAFQYVP